MALMPAEPFPPARGSRPEPFELRVRNELGEVGRVSEWLNTVADAHGIPDELRFRLDLALTEAVTNVISYAYPGRCPREFLVRCRREADRWVVEVEDDGVAFNPLENEPPPLAVTLEDARIGGLGIHLIRAYMDDCQYRREGGKNLLRLTARPRPAP
jgi:anti-sigma regulatory factor (Ser/Thr protein kinase)